MVFKNYFTAVLFFIMLALSNSAEGKVMPYTGKQGEDAFKELVTVITSTHPVPGIPSTAMLERTQKSLFRIAAFRGCKKIIVFDGISDDLGYLERRIPLNEREGKSMQELINERYETYKENVKKLVQNDPYFANTLLIFCEKRFNLAFAIEKALKSVTTPFIFIHQHDLEHIKDIDAVNVIKSMQKNPNIKQVRLNVLGNQQNEWDSLLDEYVEGGSSAPLLRTNLWSDQDHFCSVQYYTDFILPKLYPKCCMEWVMMPEEKKEIEKNIGNHRIYGTYVYGRKGESQYLRHLDGSRSYGENWEY